jgi:hypothetical protein
MADRFNSCQEPRCTHDRDNIDIKHVTNRNFLASLTLSKKTARLLRETEDFARAGTDFVVCYCLSNLFAVTKATCLPLQANHLKVG